jgi:hypothetical protein
VRLIENQDAEKFRHQDQIGLLAFFGDSVPHCQAPDEHDKQWNECNHFTIKHNFSLIQD